MKYDITNIPVGEIFEEQDGCPICRLRNKLENRAVEYITGAAMMEPDIRQETNRLGFCLPHYRQMLKQRNRLGVALILESHLAELDKQIFEGMALGGTKQRAKAAKRAGESCFVCRQVDSAMEKMLATVCRSYEEQREFRQLFEQQPCLCLPHFTALVEAAETAISKKNRGDFKKEAKRLAQGYMTELRGDIRHFAEMYDYRNVGEDADWGNSKDSVERSIWYLTSREP